MNTKIFYVYIYRDIDGRVIYVGKGCGDRVLKHIKGDTQLGRLLKKRLRDGFKIEPEFLCKDVDEEFAFFVEIEMIRHYGREDLKLGTLFNRTDGGEGTSGHIHSNESKEKMRKPRSAEQIINIANAQKGKKLSDEHKSNIGFGLKGKPKSIEHNAKNSAALLGRIFTDEHKSNLRKPKIIGVCPHCGFEGSLSRWHNNNCKKRILNV